MKKINMIGNQYGDLVVIAETNRTAKNRDRYCLVRCICGKEKEILSGHLRAGNTKNCGCKYRSSIYDYLIGTRVGTYQVIERIPSTQKDRVTKYKCRCDCGKITNIPAHTLAQDNIKTCKYCMRKEKHPAWKGGISSEYNRYYSIKAWREFRKRVFDKFGGAICLKCKSVHTKTNRIEIHHIYSYINNPELVEEIDNTVPLCRKCHTKFHHEYGRGDNTPEQLQIFLDLTAKDSCEIIPKKQV